MPELPAPPSRLLKWVAGAARWALALAAAAWLVLAASWAALHVWIVPRIDSLRPALERQAQRALGVPVRIGALAARSEGAIPAVELSDVVLLDPSGQAALRLPRVVVALSPRSLLRLGFEQVYLEAPELDVERTADGRFLVAGIAFRASGEADSRAADWLFAQPELAIRGGTLRFADRPRGAPPLALTQVDLVIRNGARRHALRLDATPSEGWGERFSLRGQFRQPLLSTHAGRWQQWSGELYADFPQVDVSRLGQHLDLGRVRVARGSGRLRAWADVRRGAVSGALADLALAEVEATLDEGLQPLALQDVQGRAGARRLEQGFELTAQGLRFRTGSGLHWPGGDLLLRHTGTAETAEGELQASALDLEALAQVAARLPLGDDIRGALQRHAPAGSVQDLEAHWRGPLAAPRSYRLRAQARGLSVGMDTADAPAGLRGLDLQLSLDQSGGQATLSLAQGVLRLPTVFEEADVPLQRLAGTVRWQVEGERISVQAPALRFANADAEGEARLEWHTGDAAGRRLPGVLDLSGRLVRADGARVHRYLPLAVPAEARHYVRDAVRTGRASQVQFRVRGDLRDFPFAHVPSGEFRVTAQVQGVDYAYVPAALRPVTEAPWPALSGLSGELVFDRAGMQVRNARGSFAGFGRLRAGPLQARIDDLEHPVVQVDGEVRGPLGDMLSLVRGSPVAGLTQGALDAASATGPAALQLGLTLPVGTLERATVRGRVQLGGNDVQMLPQTPWIRALRGAVQFDEGGFALEELQGRALGGELRLEGGMRASAAGEEGPAVRVRARGTASAEGLRTGELPGLAARLAGRASGSTGYALELGVRRGLVELDISSDLRGLALDLPAPLDKAAAAALPLQVQRRARGPGGGAQEDRLDIRIGETVQLAYERSLQEGGDARVLRGSIAVGDAAREPLALPERGVVANAVFDALDVDGWMALLHTQEPAAAAGGTPPRPHLQASAADAVEAYLPDRIGLRAGTLGLQGRALRNVVAGISRDGAGWRASVDAAELNGYLHYQPGEGAEPGRLSARLARLALPQAEGEPLDALLDDAQAGQQALPALDVVVQDFQLRGRSLGRLEIEAQNRAAGEQREWRLARFDLTVPEARLRSNGNWALLGGASGAGQRRRTALRFTLDVADSGALLARFGMDGVLRRGSGRLDGNVAWLGSPLAPDYASMTGQLHMQMNAGQFLKAEPGLAKLLSVLSLQSLPRRLALDFRDVFSEGFAFDFVRGDVAIDRGVARTNNLQMKGVNAAVLMEGEADIDRETQDLHVVVVPEINAMTASLVATAINPVIGLSSFLAQMFLRGPLMQAATQEFRIDGTWDEPRVQRLPRSPRPAGPPPSSGDKP